ncbi:MAG TPA: hypothetical protein VN043_08150 [Rhodanobacter sp.]|nr:hypothetical protein [Rhodanobacter sp.]
MGRGRKNAADNDSDPVVPFKMTVAPDGQITLVGRPAWADRAKIVTVNQDAEKGHVEDRRHMLHWDEQLRPILASVLGAMFQQYQGRSAALREALVKPLKEKKYIQRIAGDAHAVAERVAKEINSSAINLVPDRADINHAIEFVRERVRKLTRRLVEDATLTGKVGQAMRDPWPNDAIMEIYLETASETLLGGTSDDTPIKIQIQEICFQIVGLVQSCRSPCDFVMLLHQVTDSVTFDLSEKALREQTARTLSWLRTMETNVHEPAETRYEALLTLLA